MKVVNLFAGPGAGKSTTGAMLYGMLQLAGYAAEYVPEFAKVLTWQNHTTALKDQLYLFAKQDHRLEVLREQPLDFVIMDGPLLNAAMYAQGEYFKNFEPLVVEVFNSYDNANFFLERNPSRKYQHAGRSQDPEQAAKLCERTLLLLDRYQVPYIRIPVTDRCQEVIFKALTGRDWPVSVA